MNKIEFLKDKIPFTQVANGVLTDKRLSAKAKGLYAYLYSKPDGWDFAIDRIALEMADGRRSINEGLHELEDMGFLSRRRQADGRCVYAVHFPPIEPNVQNEHLGKKPNVQNSKVLKQQSAKTATVSNKDSLIIKNIKNKDIAETSSASSDLKEKKEFSFLEEKLKLEENPRRDLNIIALYMEYRQKSLVSKITSVPQFMLFLKRHLKPAGQLKRAEYSDEQIIDAFDAVVRKYKDIDWTLETIVKELTK